MKSKKVKIENRGGFRPGSGAKKSINPKIPVTFYILSSTVNSYSSINEFKEFHQQFFAPKQK